jgi:class 3 adenylate cyclase
MAGKKKSENAAGGAKRRFSISLRIKFGFFTVMLIALVMSAVGYSLFVQQRETLTRETIQRGRTVVQGLVDAARDAILLNEELRLALAAKKAAQPSDTPLEERLFDLDNVEHVIRGLKSAKDSLVEELPAQLEKSLQSLGVNINLGLDQSRKDAAARKSVENEGIFEAYVVDLRPDSPTVNQIIGHSAGYANVGPYQRPAYFQQASEETPYPVYVKDFEDQSGLKQRVNLFDVSEKIKVGESVIGEVHIGMSQDLIQKVVFQSTMKLAVVGIGAVVVGLVFTYLLVSLMVAPIGALVKGVLAIAGGDFDSRVKVGFLAKGNELGELTNAFNTMSKSLSENEMLRGAFTRYVSDAALKQILADPSKTGLHSRRALATIYSSDVRGFTAMSESLEPEHVVQVINTYLSLQTEVILKYEGVVDKFIGDAAIGVFGKEQERDDDALRAVKAALAVQATIAQLNVEREKAGEVAKQIGIGINTGIVVTGNMGSTKKMEYTTAGENRILADKLCDNCPGGKVWITESTFELLRDEIIAEEKEPLKLKGRAEAVPVFEVIGLK